MGQPYSNIQTVFSKGEWSPRLIGRVDNDSYYSAYKYAQNMVPFTQGSITKRPGTRFVSEVKDSADQTRLIPFKFSTIQNYIIEAGDLYFRFYRSRGIVDSTPGVPYELVTPWPASIIHELKFTQSADKLFVFHQDYRTRVISRTADTSWSISNYVFEDGPWLPQNKTPTTISPTAATTGNTTTITASTSIFVAGDVGRWMRLATANSPTINTFTYVEITGYTSGTVVTAVVRGDNAIPGSLTTTRWRFSYFGGSQKWPAVGTIYEERMIMANTVNYPSTCFVSVVGDFENFQPSSPTDGTVSDDDGFVVTIGDDQVNAINWLSSGRVLLIGTSGAELSMTGGSANTYAPLTPNNVTIKRESNFGSSKNCRVRRIGSAVIYASATGLKLRELAYDFSIDSYVSRDMTQFSDHITKTGVFDFDYQQEPDTTLWCARNDGQLLGFTYNKEQQVEGWHRHILGGTNTKVKSVACIPRPDLSGDDVWLIVSRTIDGATVQYVEYLTEFFDTDLGNNSAFFVDSGLSYDGRLAATLTPGATTGTGITFTASASVFSAGDVGKQLRSGLSRATITGYTNATTVIATINVAFDSTSPIAQGEWALAIKTVSGLDHLEAEEVAVFSDGAVQPRKTVDTGEIELDRFASVIHVGLPYINYMILLPVEARQFGTIQGRIRGISRIHVYVTDTMLLEYGALTEQGITDEVSSLIMNVSVFDEAPPLINGILTRDPPSGYSQQGLLYLGQNSPTPLTINYVVQEIDING